MEDFIFKMPKLPEQSALDKRKGNNLTRQKNENENLNGFRTEGNSNSFQSSLFNRRNVFGNHSQLEPLREGIEECLAKPSTSQCRRVLQNSNNKVGVSHSLFGKFGNDGINDFGINAKRSSLSVTVGENQPNSVFNLVHQPRMPYSAMGGEVYRNNLNFSSSHNSHHSSILSSCFKNSFHDKSEMYRGMNSGNFFNQSRYAYGNNVVEPLHSSLNMRKSVFGTETLPKRFGMARDTTVSGSRNNFNSEMNSFGCMSRANALPKDSNILFNTSQSIIENQTIMKSVLQMSLVSVKEQIMNKLENLGHTLLRNAPGMESSFAQAAKDIKNILENSVLVNPVSNTTGMMSFVSYLSGGVNGPQQSILHNETNREQFEIIKKPSNIIQSLNLKRNGNPKFELIESFTMNQKKKKNEENDDLSSDERSIMEDFNYASRKSNGKKELYLRNWYPIFQENSLGFVGINEENVQMGTGAMKKRINNRKILLDNGGICYLIGNPPTGKSFPEEVSAKIKNGLPKNWRVLGRILDNFQKSTKKDNGKIMEGDVSTTTEFETSFNATVMTRSSMKLLKISKMKNRKLKKEKENLDLVSPKVAVKKEETTKEAEQWAKKRVSDETKNKTEINGKKRSRSPVEKHPVKIQKTETTRSRTVEEPENEDGLTERILCTTKSGRIVKRPKDIFLGGSSKQNIKPETSKTEKEKETEKENDGEQPRKAIQATKSVKVRKPKENKETKSLKPTVRREAEDIYKSPVATKGKGKTTKKVTSKSTMNGNCNTSSSDNPWGNDIDGLDDIIVPNISIHHEEKTSDPTKLKLLSMETPPLKNIRSNLTFLKTCTPVQSPDWQISHHTRSAVKKFETLRAQAFKKKIPKENGTKKEKKSKTSVRSNKDVDTVLNWISEREVRSPKKCSNLINYIMPKRNELEDEEENSGNEMEDEEEI